jgi:thiamine kinase-like enzyme
MGDPCFDLGNLSVNNGFEDADDGRLLSAYHGQHPTPAQSAALKLMRVLSDVREAAWGVMQTYVSQLDFDFDAYAEKHFERMQTAAGDPEFGAWLAAAEG